MPEVRGQDRLQHGETASLGAVIATYNAPADRLGRAVTSAVRSGAGSVVVVDDGSTPAVDAAVLQDLGGGVGVIRQSNAGPAAARNAGLGAVAGEWVVFVDDDDELIPAGVEHMVRTAARLGVAGAVASRVHVRADGREEDRPVPSEWADVALPHPSHVLRPIGLFGASGCLVSRRAIDAGVRFDTGLRLGEDRDFLHKVATFGGLAVCSAAAVRVAIHQGASNLSSPAHYARRIRDHLVVLDRYQDEVARVHLREATRWLVNASAKAGVDAESWSLLVQAARARGWSVPVKARLRRLIK